MVERLDKRSKDLGECLPCTKRSEYGGSEECDLRPRACDVIVGIDTMSMKAIEVAVAEA